jgi:hypothetical protein
MIQSMASNNHFNFLQAGGEMGELILAKDWSQTALSEPSGWPQNLCYMAGVMLENPFGMLICRGEPYTPIYNNHQGKIIVENKWSKSAIFTYTIPLATETVNQ